MESNQTMEIVLDKPVLACFVAMTIGFVSVCGVLTYKMVEFPSTEIGVQVNADAKEAYKVLDNARVGSDNFNHASIDMRMYYEQQLPDINAAFLKFLNNGDKTVASANLSAPLGKFNTSLDSFRETASKLPDLTDNINTSVKDLDTSIKHLDGVVTSPHVQNIVANTDTASSQLAGAATDVHTTTTDVQNAVHVYTHTCSWFTKLFGCKAKETKK